MANFNKKWGTVMACWAVALVMIITGVCLGLTVPSSAAGEYEGEIAVMFDGETTTYNTLTAAFDAANSFTTTDDKAVKITLMSDVVAKNIVNVSFESKNCILDLNGHILDTPALGIDYSASKLKITDSNPTAVHYFAYIGNGKYEYTNKQIVGFNSPVYGGVIIMPECRTEAYGQNSGISSMNGGELILDGGTYVGTGYVWAVGGKVVINQGVNFQLRYDESDINKMISFVCMDKMDDEGENVLDEFKMEINGGNIYGEILYADMNVQEMVVVNLTDKDSLPKAIHIADEIELKPQTDANGNSYYESVKKGTGETTTTPTEPIAEAEPTNNNSNLIGLIILAVAAAVMVVGVTVIIIVNAKRRNKKAA